MPRWIQDAAASVETVAASAAGASGETVAASAPGAAPASAVETVAASAAGTASASAGETVAASAPGAAPVSAGDTVAASAPGTAPASAGATRSGAAVAAFTSASIPATGAGAGSEEADALGWPVGGEGAADDPGARNRSPEAAVVGSPTVVAHHEVVVGGNGDRARKAAVLSPAAGPDEVLHLTLPVEDHVAVLDRQPVARSGHDALDEVDVGLLLRRPRADLALGRRAAAAGVVALRPGGRVEDDHVADVGVAEAVADSVDEDALALDERRDHRLRRDPVRLDEERLDAERQAERDGDDHDQLQQRAGSRRAPLGPPVTEAAHYESSSEAAASVASVSSATAAGSSPPPAASAPSASASACSSTASPGTSASASAAAAAAGSCSRPASTISSGPT